jgi:hypothetical protein
MIPQQDAKEDGILPLSGFKSAFVSNTGNYLVLNPGQNKTDGNHAPAGSL